MVEVLFVVIVVVGLSAATVVFVRFLGLERSCGAFSLSSSAVEIWSLLFSLALRPKPTCVPSTHLILFKLFRFGTLSSLSLSSSTAIAEAGGSRSSRSARSLASCSSSNSCIFLFLNATGIRLMRRSNCDRKACACSAYVARSLRARSVTSGSCQLVWKPLLPYLALGGRKRTFKL